MKFPINPVRGELFKTRTNSNYAYQWDGEVWEIVSIDRGASTESDGNSDGLVKKLITDIYNEEPVGTVDGKNSIFSLKTSPIIGSEKIYLNGLIQRNGSDYMIVDKIIYLTISPEKNERIVCSYSKLSVLEISNEIPIGLLDGKNRTFFTRRIPIESSEFVYLNGLLLKKGENFDYVISNNVFTLSDTLFPGEKIICSYQTIL